MSSKSGIKSVAFLYFVFVLLLGIVLFVATTYFTYIITIYRPDGQVSRSDWPKQYTDSFSEYISMDGNLPQINGDGQKSLQKNNLWIQFLDEEGNEMADYFKPTSIPINYSIAEITQLISSSELGEYSVFLSSGTVEHQNYNYIIGFPIHIAKTTMYFNGDRFSGGRPIALFALGGVCVLVFLAGIIYGAWLTSHLSKIVNSANDIAVREYTPVSTGGTFGDAYRSLNVLDAEIRKSDAVSQESDRLREEWIVNITHDLKTPLSPIKGYAELMGDEKQIISPNDTRKYSRTILKSVVHAEGLINDLKLTYQLEGGVFPVRMETVNIPRLVKEIVIDLLNNPKYKSRSIEYHSGENEIYTTIDTSLIRRTVSNIIINALIHNAPETEIVVAVTEIGGASITVRDNGKGLTEEEQKNLFSRYYRGTNTEGKPESSGLGLAIAKSVVELHHGTIAVQSSGGKGTSVTVVLPIITE